MRPTATEVILVEATKDTPVKNIYLRDLKKTQILAFLMKMATYPDRYSLALAVEYPDPFKEEGKEMVTLTEYLSERKIAVDRSQKHRLANIVNELYIERYGMPPKVITRPNSAGKWLSRASAFERDQTGILDEAIDQVFKD